MNRIGNNIKRLRMDKGLTQQELADKLSVTNKTISKWETGRNLPDVNMIGNIALLFDVSVDEIINNKKTYRNKTKRLFIVLFIELLVFMLWMFIQQSMDKLLFIVNMAFPNILSLFAACITSYFISVRHPLIKALKYGVYISLVFYNLLILSAFYPGVAIGVFMSPANPLVLYPIVIMAGIIIGI